MSRGDDGQTGVAAVTIERSVDMVMGASPGIGNATARQLAKGTGDSGWSSRDR
jgi:short-subunit dehydrogenase